MDYPEKYRLTTDYGTIANDTSSNVLQVTIPSSLVIPDSTVYQISSSMTVGKKGAGLRGQISSSKDSNRRYVGLWQSRMRLGTVPGYPSGFDYYTFLVVSRTSATQVTFSAYIVNQSGGTLTTASGSETFTATFATFLSIFEL